MREYVSIPLPKIPRGKETMKQHHEESVVTHITMCGFLLAQEFSKLLWEVLRYSTQNRD